MLVRMYRCHVVIKVDEKKYPLVPPVVARWRIMMKTARKAYVMEGGDTEEHNKCLIRLLHSKKSFLGPRSANVARIAAGKDWEPMSFEDIEWEHFKGPGQRYINHDDQASVSSICKLGEERMKIRNSIKAEIEHLKIKKGMVESQVRQLDRQIIEKEEEKKIHENQECIECNKPSAKRLKIGIENYIIPRTSSH